MTIASQEISLVEKAETVQGCFTLEGESLRAQPNKNEQKVYVNSYMANYGSCFVVCENLRHAHLEEVG